MRRFVLMLAIMLMSREAFAFCRTTTCNPTPDDDCDADDKGCPTRGKPVFWEPKSMPIPYAFTERGTTKLDDAKVRAAVRKAVDKWQSVVCSGGGRTTLRFEELADIPAEEGLGLASDDSASGKDDGTPKFGLYFRDESWKQSSKVLALTTLSYEGPRVNNARMEINTSTTDFRFDSQQTEDDHDFQAIMTHEMGHWIGLAHSREKDSIMAAVYCHRQDRCEGSVGLKRALSRDDTAAVCALYPPLRATLPPTGDPDAEMASCTQSPGASSGAGAAVVVVGLLAVARKRRSFRADG